MVVDNCVVVDSPLGRAARLLPNATSLGRGDRRQVPGRLSASVSTSRRARFIRTARASRYRQLRRHQRTDCLVVRPQLCRIAPSALRRAMPTAPSLDSLTTRCSSRARSSSTSVYADVPLRRDATFRPSLDIYNLFQRGYRPGDEHHLRPVVEGRHTDSQRTPAARRGAV
jgi:hypothetical protein